MQYLEHIEELRVHINQDIFLIVLITQRWIFQSFAFTEGWMSPSEMEQILDEISSNCVMCNALADSSVYNEHLSMNNLI